ncbi:MAG: cobalamin-dependent protein [Deltaproteobacteria bacterium]|nr:cobalamin-dependent protein [Deltaproteobacteria bacterium]
MSQRKDTSEGEGAEMPKTLSKLEQWERLPKPVSRILQGAHESTAEARKELLETIQDEIIPRLVVAHHREIERGASCEGQRPPPTPREVEAFASLATTSDLSALLAVVEKLGEEGLTLETVLLDLVGPAARHLGDQWLTDERSFAEVTVGLSTLQQVVHVLAPSFAPGIPDRGLVVLASPLNEQHTLGIYILGEFLRRAGWGVRVAPSLSREELVAVVEAEHVEMVGLTVSVTDVLVTVDQVIRDLKRVALNPEVIVMVGGAHPDLPSLAARAGAVYCADAPEAVRRLEALSPSVKKKSDE